MPDFEVFDKAGLAHGRGPAVTVLKGCVLSLNRAAFDVLDGPDAVELLYDRKKRIVGLRAIAAQAAHSCYVRRAGRSANGPFLITAMAFLHHYEIDTSQSRRWSAYLEDAILCVNLEERSETVHGICRPA